MMANLKLVLRSLVAGGIAGVFALAYFYAAVELAGLHAPWSFGLFAISEALLTACALLFLFVNTGRTWWQRGLIVATLSAVIILFIVPLLFGILGPPESGGTVPGFIIMMTVFLIWGLLASWLLHRL